MNAHIQHDLPLAVVDTCRRRGCAPADVEEDYHRINGLLAEVETAVRERLMPGPDLLEHAEPFTHLLGAWSVGVARERAWSAVGALWELRHLPGAARAFAAALAGSVGLLGRALLLPLGPHAGPDAQDAHDARAARDARGTRDARVARSGDPAPTRRDTPGTAPAGRLPGTRNRPAGGSAGTPDETSGGALAGDQARPDQAQLECSGLPSA
ncbi:DUF5995 family protein [Kitasatospora sp. Ki12]